MKSRNNRRTQLQGLSVEMIGIVLLFGGPFQYMCIQIGFMVDGMFGDRYALGWFAYSMLAAILLRASAVIPDFFMEATDKRKKGRKK